MASADADHAVGAPSPTPPPAAVNSELLCFITDRSQIMAVDDLVKICSDFYTEEEIVAVVINSLLSTGPRLPKRTRVAKHAPLLRISLKPSSILIYSCHSFMLSISADFHR